MGVDCGDEVEQAGNDDEFSAIVGDGDEDGRLSPTEEASEAIKEAGAEVACESEHVEGLTGVRAVDFSLQSDADGEHADDRDREEESTDPFAEQEVARSGEEPACNEGKRG